MSVIPAGDTVYDGLIPVGDSVITQADNPGQTSYDVAHADVDISRYIDQTVGGETADVYNLGYSTGLNNSWYSRFSGGVVKFVTRNLARDTGPVGRDNSRSTLQAGVELQTEGWPTIQDIARSVAGLPSQKGSA